MTHFRCINRNGIDLPSNLLRSYKENKGFLGKFNILKHRLIIQSRNNAEK